jgi:hypothetical protein
MELCLCLTCQALALPPLAMLQSTTREEARGCDVWKEGYKLCVFGGQLQLASKHDLSLCVNIFSFWDSALVGF